MDMIYKKDCKAAFTKELLWTKKLDGNNIYDGKFHPDIVRDLWVTDMTNLMHRFKANFSKNEIKLLKEQLSKNYAMHSYNELKIGKYTSSFKFSLIALSYNRNSGMYSLKCLLRKFRNKYYKLQLQ